MSPEYKAAYYREHRTHLCRLSRNGHLKRTYGITREEFDAMVREQDNRCGICARSMEPPHVDHNHKNGVVRGLLCGSCNRMIGLAGESAETLRQAILYLQRSK